MEIKEPRVVENKGISMTTAAIISVIVLILIVTVIYFIAVKSNELKQGKQYYLVNGAFVTRYFSDAEEMATYRRDKKGYAITAMREQGKIEIAPFLGDPVTLIQRYNTFNICQIKTSIGVDVYVMCDHIINHPVQ